MLGDPKSRSEYDQHLASLLQAADDIAIAEEVQLSAMTRRVTVDGPEYELACRCSGSYIVSDSELQGTAGSIILPCSNCSLHILVEL